MKVKNIIAIVSIALIFALCATAVCASQQADNLTVNDESTQLEVDSGNSNVMQETSSPDNGTGDIQSASSNEGKAEKITPTVLCGQDFVHKKSNNLKVKIYDIDDNTNKYIFYKNVKVTVKVKIGKKTKTYNVKTNSKGEAKVFNVKNLKVGLYKLSITSPDKKYKIKEKDTMSVYGKSKKTVTLKMKKTKYGIENRKKLKNGDTIRVFYEPKNAQYAKGAYAENYCTKDPLNGQTHTMITKSKFFFKNKKSKKIISKTSKLTADKFYGWKAFKVKPIKGYTLIKAKVWYLTR